MISLNLGAGDYPAPPPWINVEVQPGKLGTDLLADVISLPYESRSVERIMAGHIVEHIPLAVLPIALAEWRRVLHPDGVLLIVAPDIDRAIRQGQAENPSLAEIIAYGTPPAGHAWTCSEPVLLDYLRRANWHAEPIPIESVHAPEWPITSNAPWQVAVWCRI